MQLHWEGRFAFGVGSACVRECASSTGRTSTEELRADQARFRKEVLSKLSAVATMLSQQGAPQGVA